ncbi:MAG TPA: polymer-forming cytoskeletal protein [Pyrinomonadaceae bacterium]|nr:polymer-forming cytoskeletal protein [Pyrinomonadaceae bacterium]
MLRMGKNPKADQAADTEHNTDSQATQYNAQRTNYAPYQPVETPAPRQTDASASASRAVTESESLARDIKEGVLSGFVGNGTTLTGEASFKGMLRVDGHLSGRVSSEGGTLIVGNNGQVDANIEVAVAVIQGSVNGDIIASQRLELGRAAKVNGNVQTPSLVIEQGAVFEGSCKMTQLRAAQDKQRADQARGISSSSSSGGSELDTSSMEPVSDTSNGETEISSVSGAAS